MHGLRGARDDDRPSGRRGRTGLSHVEGSAGDPHETEPPLREMGRNGWLPLRVRPAREGARDRAGDREPPGAPVERCITLVEEEVHRLSPEAPPA
jgi:hypothetical protein